MSPTVTVNILGDADSLRRALGDSASSLDTFAAKAQSVGERATSIGRSMTFGVTLPLVGLGKVAFDELQQSAAASAQTEAAIKSTGGAANVTAKHVDDMASALLNLSGIDDEVIKGGENVLLTFRGIQNQVGKGNDIFDQATKATLDLSVAFGKDMNSSAILVGKALQDPIQGISALQRVGVQFTQGQRDQIKAMVEAGDTMGAQKLILKELRTEVGGSAKAYGDSLAGQVGKAQEQFKNAAAEIMGAFAPAMKTIANLAVEAAQTFANLPEPVKAVGLALAGIVAAVGPVTYVFGAVSKAVSGAISVFEKVSSVSGTAASALGSIIEKAGALGFTMGPVGIIAGSVAVGIAGLTGAFDEQGASIEEIISKLNRMTNAELAAYIQKVNLAAQETGIGNLAHAQFGQILEKDSTVAQRWIEVLQSQGQNTDWYTNKLISHLEHQQASTAANEEARAKIEALKASLAGVPAQTGATVHVNVNRDDLDALESSLLRISGQVWGVGVMIQNAAARP